MSDQDLEKQEEPEVQEDAQEEKPVHKGAILKAERERQGIDLQSVHEATKIPMDSLRAIEEDYKVKILTEFYYKSFLKIYAKYLNLDVSQVVEQEKKPVRPMPVVKDDNVNFDFSDKLNRIFTKERKRQIFYVLVAIFSFWLFVKFVGFMMHQKEKPAKVKTVQRREIKDEKKAPPAPREVKRENVSKPVVVPSEAAVTVSQPPKEAPPTEKTNNVVLTVRAKKESWLRVKVDGNIVFQSTLNEGDVETWDAVEKIEITGRHISELEFELNGKMIGSLGRASRRARGLIVTREGLSVTK